MLIVWRVGRVRFGGWGNLRKIFLRFRVFLSWRQVTLAGSRVCIFRRSVRCSKLILPIKPPLTILVRIKIAAHMIFKLLLGSKILQLFHLKAMTLGQISAVEELMRMAVTGQQHVDALIGYYRGQIDNYNNERAQWALHYEQLKDSVANKHGLIRQMEYAKGNIDDLEGKLNTIKAGLARERQMYFQGLEQNQKIKEKCEENKKRYRDMVAICKPISVVRKNDKKSEGKSSNQSSKISQPSQPRTQLELDLINLSKDHDNEKDPLLEDIDLLKAELDELLSEHSQRGQNCSREYKQLLEALAAIESKIMHLTTQYFKLRMENYETERQLQEENEILRLKAVALAKKLQLLRQSHSKQLTTVDKEVKIKNKEFQSKYDQELKQKQQHLSILKEQHQKIYDIYILKLQKLEDELLKVMDRQINVKEKYKTEKNSLRGQIKVLRNRLEKEGVREMRAQLLDEDASEESSETLSMAELEKISKEVDSLGRRI